MLNKLFICLILSGLILSSLIFSCQSIPEQSYNPCNDSLYLSLKHKSLDSLTVNQFEYLKHIDNLCSEYQNTKIKTTFTDPAIIVLSIAALALIVYLIIPKH